MAQRDMDTVFWAKQEFLSSTLSSLKELDTALLKVIESFSSAVKQSEGLNAAVGAVGKTAEETAIKEAEAVAGKAEQYKKNADTITALESEYKRLGATTAELIAMKVEEFQLQGATIEQAVEYMQLLNDIEEKKAEIAENEAKKTQGITPAFGAFYEQNLTQAAMDTELYEKSLQSLGNVHRAIYQGMTNEIMSFIETGKFSVGALGKIVAARVKIELAGIAATAAVQALFQIGMGFAKLAMYDWASAKLHFLSAAKLGLVAGASVAAAAGVNSLLGKSKDSSSGAVSASGARGGSLSAYPAPMREEAKPTQNITLQIYNPLSTQNWAEITENNILPALKAASDMNIAMNVKTVYA